MIDYSLRDVFLILSCPIWSTVLQCGVLYAEDKYLNIKRLDSVASDASFFNWRCAQV